MIGLRQSGPPLCVSDLHNGNGLRQAYLRLIHLPSRSVPVQGPSSLPSVDESISIASGQPGLSQPVAPPVLDEDIDLDQNLIDDPSLAASVRVPRDRKPVSRRIGPRLPKPPTIPPSVDDPYITEARTGPLGQ